MAIRVNLDRVLVDRKISSKELAERIGLSENNLSRFKTGKIKAVRFSSLDAICRELKCQPGDLLEYVEDEVSVSDVASAADPNGDASQWTFDQLQKVMSSQGLKVAIVQDDDTHESWESVLKKLGL